LSAVCDSQEIYGFGTLSDSFRDDAEEVFIVKFLGHYRWELVSNGKCIMRTAYGIPRLPPRDQVYREGFFRAVRAEFESIGADSADRLWLIVDAAIKARHGTTIVIVDDAADEAMRLGPQGTPIAELELSPDIALRITAIDGAVLLDRSGQCHAFGVILDGISSPRCTPSRGSRYNSAVRYVEYKSSVPVLAIVISDDAMVDLVTPIRSP
jgi:hypothetical protein